MIHAVLTGPSALHTFLQKSKRQRARSGIHPYGGPLGCGHIRGIVTELLVPPASLPAARSSPVLRKHEFSRCRNGFTLASSVSFTCARLRSQVTTGQPQGCSAALVPG